MRRIVLKYGLTSGAVISAATAGMLPLCMQGVFDFGASIGFGKAFGVGLLITLVACVCYVVVWEVVYWGFIPDFLDRYHAYVLDNLRSGGASQEVNHRKQAELETFAELYANPFFNVLITSSRSSP